MDRSAIPISLLAEARAFHDVLGHRQTLWEDGRAELELEIRPYHLNIGGVLHGGVLSALLDIACAQAGLYTPDWSRIRKAVTLSLTTTFTGQTSGGTIRVIGTLRSRGRRIFNSSGEVFSDDGRLLAMGQGTFRLRSETDGSS
jgi:uncharacterized protein (TIGR00369 family)